MDTTKLCSFAALVPLSLFLLNFVQLGATYGESDLSIRNSNMYCNVKCGRVFPKLGMNHDAKVVSFSLVNTFIVGLAVLFPGPRSFRFLFYFNKIVLLY